MRLEDIRNKINRSKTTADNVVESLITAQQSELYAYSTSSVVSSSIRDIIQKHYIKPNLRIGKRLFEGSLTEILTEKKNNLVFCIGNSGCGKSTLLTKTFLELAVCYVSTNIVPIYINFNNSHFLSCNAEVILENVFNRYKIDVDKTTISELIENYRFVFFFDALDEKHTSVELSTIDNEIANRSNNSFIMACRTNFFHQLRISNIDYLFEFGNISAEDRLLYCKSLIRERASFDFDDDVIMKLISDAKYDNIFSNILILTLFLICIIDNPDIINWKNLNIGTVLNLITNALLRREVYKWEQDIDLEIAGKILEDSAIWTYDKLYKKNVRIFSHMIKAVKSRHKTVDIDKIQKVIDVFVSKDNNFGQYKFAHSMLLDFFVAKAFARAVNSNKSIKSYLMYTFSVEINVMISELIKEYGAETAFINLKKQIPQNILKDSDLLFEFLQHMHRTEQYEAIYKYVEGLIGSSPQLNLCTKVILLHSLLVAGKEEDEVRYYELLSNDNEFAKLHIGGALKYYNNELRLRLPFYDNGKIPYERCFLAYTRHIKRIDISHYYIIRRTNLFTMRKIIELRKVVPKKVANFYLSIKADIESDNSSFGKKVAQEYNALMEKINEYPHIDISTF